MEAMTIMAIFRKKRPQKSQQLSLNQQPAAPPISNTSHINQCQEYLDMLMSSDGRHSSGVALKIYIENFKRLNEIFGYGYCEGLLSQILNYLRKTTGKRVHHFIGMEYIIVLDHTTTSHAKSICQEILERFEHVWTVGDIDCICSIQIGICSFPTYAATSDHLLNCLDMAISKAAEYGSNQMAVYNNLLHQQASRRRNIALYLNEALDRQEIEVRYRPTYNIEKQKFVRAELYLRIFVKGLGFIGAPEFTPIAEDSGQIRTLEYFALEHLGTCIASMLEKNIEFESVSTQISSLMLQQEDFLSKIEIILRRYKIPAGKLALEFSGNTYATSLTKISEVLHTLSEMGVEIILNDFGSGLFSITNLLQYPVDTVKLERMFICQLENNPQARIMVDSLVHMASNLGLKVIAEGVESHHQIKILNRADCLYQQGFYYSPTLEKHHLLQLMDSSLEESKTILDKAKEDVRT